MFALRNSKIAQILSWHGTYTSLQIERRVLHVCTVVVHDTGVYLLMTCKMAAGNVNFDTYFSSSSVASAVSIGCGASRNHDLYSQASSTGTTVSYKTTDSDVDITHEDQKCLSSIETHKDMINYMVKVISHHCEGVQLQKWESQRSRFSEVENLKSKLSTNFQDFICVTLFILGTYDLAMVQKSDRY